MISVKLTGDRELSLYINGVKRRSVDVAKRIIGRSALVVKRNVQLNLSGKVLRVRTNKLRSNIAIAHGLDRVNPSAAITANTVYAAIHEFGGTIRPRRAKYLAIPLKGVKGEPSDYPHAFVVKIKGKLYLAMTGQYRRVKGPYMPKSARMLTGKKFKLLFALRKEVVMPKRPFMAPALKDSIPEIDGIIKKESERLLS